mgnify:CR=1 FL=1
MVALYLVLLCLGVLSFLLHFYAQYRLAWLLRRRYPQQWAIIAGEGPQRPGRLQLWLRLQGALRSPALLLFEDPAITRWQRLWRYGPWVAWLCWLVAVGLQWKARQG